MPKYRKHIADGMSCTDCVGLIKGYLWSDENGKVTYDKTTDVSANGMYERAKVKGPIATMPDKPGLCARFDGHIGVYVGNGEVIEARGFDYGVVLTKLKSRPWTHWLEIPGLDYSAGGEEAKPPATPSVPSGSRPALRKGDKGIHVKDMQALLISKGYLLPVFGVDGDFGNETESQVLAFQRANGLEADGVAGPKTWEKLNTRMDDAMFSVRVRNLTAAKAESLANELRAMGYDAAAE